MREPLESAGWAGVDATAEPGRFAAFLGGYGAGDAVRAHRTRCLALLDPQPGERILDIGCGTGDDAAMLATRMGDGLVVGIDRSRELLRIAGESGAGHSGAAVRLIAADACSLPLADAAADAVWIERVLQHLRDPASAVREAIRVLRPGGRFLATEPDWSTLVIAMPAAASDVSRELAAHIAEDVRHPHIGSELERLSNDAGVRTVDVLDLDLRINDAALADALLALPRRVLELCALGEIDDAAAHAWLTALGTAASAGGFSLEMRCVTVFGRRPVDA